jgi:hypothetical protein
MKELLRALRELRSLLADPTTGNMEAARVIVEVMCKEAGIVGLSTPGEGV